MVVTNDTDSIFWEIEMDPLVEHLQSIRHAALDRMRNYGHKGIVYDEGTVSCKMHVHFGIIY